MVKVLGLGDNVCDIYLNERTMYPGGQAVNFAVYAGMLGVKSDFMGVFGNDAIAGHVKASLDAHSVGYSHCRSYAGENGFARVMIVDGDRVFKGSNKGGVIQKHPIRLEKEDLEYADGFDLIHTTNNGFTDDLLPDLHVLSPFVSYDFSYRWNEEDRVDRVCPYIDFVIPVDTMGAGDSFATAMLVTILKKLEEESEANWEDPEIRMKILPVALKTAAAFSAKTCLIKGAFGGGVQVPDSVYAQVYKDLS